MEGGSALGRTVVSVLSQVRMVRMPANLRGQLRPGPFRLSTSHGTQPVICSAAAGLLVPAVLVAEQGEGPISQEDKSGSHPVDWACHGPVHCTDRFGWRTPASGEVSLLLLPAPN